MKGVLHGGRKGSAEHNDHNFESPHIDKEKSKGNRFYFGDENAKNCYEADLYVFLKLYSDALEKQNEKYRSKGQYDRIRSMKDWITGNRYCSREEILQIGDMKDHASVDGLEECIKDYLEWKRDKFGSRMITTSVALHTDESTPHGHERSTWYYIDADGMIKPGIAKALEQLGVPLPDETAKPSKTNNRMMTYTAMCREKWEEICISHGYQLDTQRSDRKLGHMDPEAWKAYCQAMDDVRAREAAVKKREDILSLKERRFVRMEKEQQEKADSFQRWEDALQDQQRVQEERESNLNTREKAIEQREKEQAESLRRGRSQSIEAVSSNVRRLPKVPEVNGYEEY